MCLFKDAIEAPNLCVGIAIIIPLVVLGIVRGLPIKSLSSDSVQTDKIPTSIYLVRTSVICALIYAAAVALCMIILCSRFMTQLMGIRIDSQSLQVSMEHQ